MEPYKIEEYRGYQIKIEYDESCCTDSPREWCNVCTMNCYHKRYSLGDNKCKGDPYDDLRSLILEHISTKEIISLIQKHADNVKITHNNKQWKLYQLYANHATGTTEFELYDELDLSDTQLLCERAVYAVADKYLFDIVDNSSTVAISNIYMYDHSGITISLGRFSCPWDSGCLGFIYVAKERVLKEVGGANEKNWKQKANEHFGYEVESYDAYLRGEIFGWGIYECINSDEEDEEPEYDESPVDSCWGYIGESEIEYMVSEAKASIDSEIKQKEIAAAKEAEELARKREIVIAGLSAIPIGTTFIFGNEAYQVNSHNLFNDIQVSVTTITKHQIGHAWTPVTIDSLEAGVIEVLYTAIKQLKAA